MNVIIIGCGVSGLSSGIRLLEAGYNVEIWARDLPPKTTSNISAALWYPYHAFPADKVAAWSAATYDAFLKLLDQPEAGVIMRYGSEIFPFKVEDPEWKDAIPTYRRLKPEEMPEGYIDGYTFETPVIVMSIYLEYLIKRFQSLGGTIHQRALTSPAEALEASDIVVNCAGLGSRELVNDSSMVPIRGQIIRVSQCDVTRFWINDHAPDGIAYIIPRIDDIILGGTAQEGDENLEIDQATAEGILERCIKLEPNLRNATILEHRVGLRPGRPTVRLEAERPAPGKLLVHNYGHGGAGVTMSWGCADVVAQLVAAG
jgi:D-amino-acid oxidase